VSLTVASFSNIGNAAYWPLFLLIIVPTWLPTWLNRPEKHIRILSRADNAVVFAVRSVEYAKLLAAANCSPH
jgi:hypothetical protein